MAKRKPAKKPTKKPATKKKSPKPWYDYTFILLTQINGRITIRAQSEREAKADLLSQLRVNPQGVLFNIELVPFGVQQTSIFLESYEVIA